MTAEWTDRIKPYAGWAALVLLVAGLFSGVIARDFMFPLSLLIGAAALAIFRFWHELKTFDFWALDEWARMRYEAAGVRDWNAPHHAAEIYCSQVVVRTRNEAAAEMNTIMMELIRGQERNATEASVNFADPRASAPQRTERNAKYDAAQVRYNQCNTALSRELLTYLVRGDLLAKGLPTQDDVAKSERIIPTSRWRILTLDIAKAKATGLGWNYSGIVVGVKPKPRKPAKPPAPRAPAAKPADTPAAKVPQAQRPDLPRPQRPTAF